MAGHSEDRCRCQVILGDEIEGRNGKGERRSKERSEQQGQEKTSPLVHVVFDEVSQRYPSLFSGTYSQVCCRKGRVSLFEKNCG